MSYRIVKLLGVRWDFNGLKLWRDAMDVGGLFCTKGVVYTRKAVSVNCFHRLKTVLEHCVEFGEDS